MLKVLVVEDSDTTRNLLVSTIEDIGGLDVIDAPNAFEALRLLPRKLGTTPYIGKHPQIKGL